MYERVIAHYYVDPIYDPLSRIRTRVGAELHELKEPGDIIMITPNMMKMNCSNLGPGIYQITEVNPNNKHPEVHYDYGKYGGWLEALEPTLMAIVRPIFQTNIRTFNDYSFLMEEKINNEGVIETQITVIDKYGSIIQDTRI